MSTQQSSSGLSSERFEAEAHHRRCDPVYAFSTAAASLVTRGWDGRPNSAYVPEDSTVDRWSEMVESYPAAGEPFELSPAWSEQDSDDDDDGGVLCAR